MQPGVGTCVVIGSYTHPAYAESMAATFELMGMTALLSRGLEGESAADPRRKAQVVAAVRNAYPDQQHVQQFSSMYEQARRILPRH